MVFKRRDKQPLAVRVKEMFAPRKGWRRAIEYLGHRMRRLPDTPESIALGFACGVVTSFTPFFGFHFVVAAGLAWLLRSNLFASAVGTFFGNPITFPFIMGASLKLGGMILGTHEDAGAVLHDLNLWQKLAHLGENIGSLVVPYFIGGLIPGLICATISYFLIKPLVATYQKRRRARLMARAKARLAASAARLKPAE